MSLSPHFQTFRYGRRLWFLVLAMLFIAVIFESTLAQAENPNRAGLVIDHGNGTVVKQCLEFSESEISGYELLEKSGLDLNIEASSGIGVAICRIDGRGCTYPEDECFCRCSGGGECVFWSYWYQDNGDWQFSGSGASKLTVRNGDMQAWVWGEGSVGSSGTEPPALKFDDICLPMPTATHTSQPTATPAATATPEPTNTPKPKEKPEIHSFSASQTTIAAGQSVQLSWDLSDAEAAFLRYNGREEGVIAPGSKTVSPTENTVYTLVAKNDGGETTSKVTVTVSGAVPMAPTAAPLPAATDTPAPVAVAAQNASPTATPTATGRYARPRSSTPPPGRRPGSARLRSRIREAGGFSASGELTIRDVTRAVELPFHPRARRPPRRFGQAAGDGVGRAGHRPTRLRRRPGRLGLHHHGRRRGS